MTTSRPGSKPVDRSNETDERRKAAEGRDPDQGTREGGRTPHSSATKPDAEIRPAENHDEALIDEAIMESFPASDPISPKASTTPDRPKKLDEDTEDER
jgi:hypothetical protein